jgi:hypothetical protein
MAIARDFRKIANAGFFFDNVFVSCCESTSQNHRRSRTPPADQLIP